VIEYWKDEGALEPRLERVVAIIAEATASPDFPLRELVAAAAEPSGKLLRPALLLIGSDFGRVADAERTERLAAAVEILHVATLIHDDIIDESPLRRGKPSLYASAGVTQAVLAGDWLFSRCFHLAAQSAGPDNTRGLARLIAAICASEISQDMGKYEFSPSKRRYLRTIAGKTAALFSLALYAGASEAKAGRHVEQTLRRAGYCIGMAFQMMDDILDFEADEDVMRKPVGQDIAEGLCTLPLVYASASGRATLAPLLERVAEAARAGDHEARDAAAREAAARTVELGGVEAARADAARFTSRALGEIAKLPRGSARDELAALAERLLHRAY
jgi:Geranylgeranyl pyrophosphate synthase